MAHRNLSCPYHTPVEEPGVEWIITGYPILNISTAASSALEEKCYNSYNADVTRLELNMDMPQAQNASVGTASHVSQEQVIYITQLTWVVIHNL